MTDSDLIASVLLNEDHAAFGELIRRHQSAVRHFLLHLSGADQAEVDDLAQETFVQAWRGLSTFRANSAFSTWLLGIAHNHWRNARRRRRTEPLEPVHEARAETLPPPSSLSDLRHDLDLALRCLGEEERTALHLFYQQGLSHSEIAAVLKWPLGTVKTNINRGREKLRPLLAPWNPNP